MIKQFSVAAVSLLVFASVAVAQEIKHYMVNDANLIETQQGYAIMAPSLLLNNWKTVSVNGNQIQIVSNNCQQTAMNLQQLDANQQKALESAKQVLHSAESGQPQANQVQVYRSGVARYSLTGSTANVNFARNIGISSFQMNGLSLTKYDDQNMSIGKSTGLPNNLSRIFLTGDVVTFVYGDGRVQMKPLSCLQPEERQLVDQLKREAQQAQGQFQTNMNQFGQNMNNMNNRLQQNMQQMNRNLNNMFNRNNFPFNYNTPNNQFFQSQNPQPMYQQHYSFGLPQNFMQTSFRPFMPSVNMNGLSSGFPLFGGSLANRLPFANMHTSAGPFASSFQFNS